MTDSSAKLLARARQWLEAEPDPEVARELAGLIDGPTEALADRFDGTLRFGTAGLRAPLGAGPLRMNRIVVRHAAAGVAQWLLDHVDDAARRGVVIGFDARYRSDEFALESARVFAAAGFVVCRFEEPVPTPVVAFAVSELDAAGAVVVTASHNPPGDSGYKVYLESGAQIVAPIDTEIAAAIDAIDPFSIELADARDPRITRCEADVVDRYLDHVAGLRLRPEVPPVPVAYTAMHGVGGAFIERAFAAAGLGTPILVPEQHDPDPEFSTVAFPNPEEPGAMDRVIAVAIEHGAGVALANDPDADRLGVAVIDATGRSRLLTGDEIGWLLADHVLGHTAGDDRLVITTMVSSSLLFEMARAHGVHAAEVPTGFKWIAAEARRRPGQRLVFAYEQALGYLVGARPLDKDGIGAAVVMAEIAAVAAADGMSLLDRLEQIASRYGRHLTAQRSIRMEPTAAEAAVAAVLADPPTEVGGVAVADITGFDEAGLVRLALADGTRLQIRPSGTEPKVKLYAEVIDGDPEPALDALLAQIIGP